MEVKAYMEKSRHIVHDENKLVFPQTIPTFLSVLVMDLKMSMDVTA